MLQIKTSLDWSKVETEIRKLGSLLPEFDQDIKRIRNNVNTLVKELSQLEVEARSSRSRSMIDKCNKKAERINEELKQLQRFHLMSLLSR
jgi:ppGpp synthetase/RelA/SpoT-type nucleotidyltranferase